MNTQQAREVLDPEFERFSARLDRHFGEVRSEVRKYRRDFLQCMFAGWLVTMVYFAALVIVLLDRR